MPTLTNEHVVNSTPQTPEKRRKNPWVPGICNIVAAVVFFTAVQILVAVAKANPAWVTHSYKLFSRGILRFFSYISGILPLSVAEMILYITILSVLIELIVFIVRLVFAVVKRRFGAFVPKVFKYISGLLLSAASLVFFFQLFWGLNYYGESFAEEHGIQVRKYSVAELKATTASFVAELNALAGDVPRNIDGVCDFEDFRELTKMAQDSYDSLCAEGRFFGGATVGRAKPVLASEIMSYAGITGIFAPYTGEANVNYRVPESSIPFTMAHELAHSLGVAPENEANFAAFLACRASGHIEFRYSGALAAFVHCYNALAGVDRDAAYELWYALDGSVIADLTYRSEYWKRYEGKIEKTATAVNNFYLQANDQSDGVKSYGMVADLLIADYLERNESPKK